MAALGFNCRKMAAKNGYDHSIFVNPEIDKDYECCICSCVLRNAVLPLNDPADPW